jgi:hypothetical protein
MLLARSEHQLAEVAQSAPALASAASTSASTAPAESPDALTRALGVEWTRDGIPQPRRPQVHLPALTRPMFEHQEFEADAE